MATQSPFDRLTVLLRDPAARELNAILGQMSRLRRRFARFRADHGPRCRCPCCRYVSLQTGTWEEIDATIVILRAFADLLNCGRPFSWSDIDRLP